MADLGSAASELLASSATSAVIEQSGRSATALRVLGPAFALLENARNEQGRVVRTQLLSLASTLLKLSPVRAGAA